MIPDFLDSNLTELHLTHVKKVRNYLSQPDPNSKFVAEIFESGIVPYLISFLIREELELKLEATWVLTNLIYGDSIYAQQTLGAIPLLIPMIEHSNVEISQQTVYCLGNYAGDGPLTRELILDHGGLQPLVRIARKLERKRDFMSEFLELVMWTLSNLCISLSRANLFLVTKEVIPLFDRFLDDSPIKVQVNVCRGLANLSLHDEKKIVIELFEEHQILSTLVQLISVADDDLLQCILEVIENMSTCFTLTNMQNLNILSILEGLFLHSNKNIRALVCLILFHFVDGPINIQTIIDRKFLPPLIKLFLSDHIYVRTQSAYVFQKLLDSGDVKQIEYVVNLGLVPLVLSTWDSVENYPCSPYEKTRFLCLTLCILKKAIDRSKETDSKICQQFLSSLKSETYMSKLREFAARQEKACASTVLERIQTLLKEIEDLKT
jgi:hypothetical protein